MEGSTNKLFNREMKNPNEGVKMDSFIFKDFSEYYHYCRHLNPEQSIAISNNLSKNERDMLQKSCSDGKWEDIIVRNEINKKVDFIKDEYNIDLIENRFKVRSGKSVYIKEEVWNYVLEEIGEYDYKHVGFLLEGIIAKKVNEETAKIPPC